MNYYDDDLDRCTDWSRVCSSPAITVSFLWALQQVGQGRDTQGARQGVRASFEDAYTPEEREVLIHKIKADSAALLDESSQRSATRLVAYGRELEAAGAAQVGGSFTGDPRADALLETDPNAFLLGVLFTQGIPAERAWRGPWLLRERLGTLDLDVSRAEPAGCARGGPDAADAPPLQRDAPALDRVCGRDGCFVTTTATRRASGRRAAHVVEVVERLSAFDGIGRKKAVMAVEILTRHFGVELEGREYGQVAYDVQVRRVFLRTGLVDEDRSEAIERAAAELCPRRPGRSTCPRGSSDARRAGPSAPLRQLSLGRHLPAVDLAQPRRRWRAQGPENVGLARALVLLGRAKNQTGEQLRIEVRALLRHGLAGEGDRPQLVHAGRAQERRPRRARQSP